MRTWLICFTLLSVLTLCGQTATHRLFRMQERIVSRSIQKHLPLDTLISTGQASIHIHYSRQPGKPYLLLLHGMGIDARTNWFRQIPYLSGHFNLLVPDLIFFGRSLSPEKDYSPEFQARQIHQALSLLNIPGEIHVMGFSYGGLTAALYNELYPEEVNRLVIVDGPVKFFSAQTADSLARSAGAAGIAHIIVPRNPSDFKAMQKAVLSKKLWVSRRFQKKIIAHYFLPTLNDRERQLTYLAEHQTHYQALDYQLDITPTLLIWGARDGVVPLSVGERLHQRFPATTQLLILKKGKHDSHFRYFKKVNKTVLNFLTN